MRVETVVVTGASAGLGRAIAVQFGKHGARVALLARGREGLAAAEREVIAAGGEAFAIPTDVADPAAVEAAAEAAEEKFGPIDVWVNNAMVSVFAPVKEMQPDEYKRATEVTYLGTVYGTLAALKRMQPRDRGAIVQVGSALAYRSIPLQSAYCAAKHAIVGFTDSLRCELLHDNSKIHMSVVHMPALNTAQFGWVRNKLPHKAQPVPPIFEPEVGARAVYWAAHHTRREVYVGGSTVKAIVGNKIAPGLLDRYLAHMGYSSQQTAEPEDPSRPDNLWSPLDAQQDHGAHGDFDSRSRSRSAQSWMNLHRGLVGAIAGGAAGLAGALYVAYARGKICA
jgi:NAD(P)-dependent dehydrogenase (short-subunit alcohol dehydrogenase family)